MCCLTNSTPNPFFNFCFVSGFVFGVSGFNVFGFVLGVVFDVSGFNVCFDISGFNVCFSVSGFTVCFGVVFGFVSGSFWRFRF